MQKTSSPRVGVLRIAVLIMFFTNGALVASWISRIPHIQNSLSLSEGQLGIVLLGLAAGVLTALSLTSGLISRYGDRQVTLYGAVGMCLMLPVLGILPNALMLWTGLFLFGMTMSSMDVAMNAQGVVVEQLAKRPLMSAFHASFSIGGFTGAAIGAGFATLELSPLLHFVSISILFLLIIIATARYLPTNEGNQGREDEGNEKIFQLPPRVLWALGAVAFAAAIGEGAMADWSGVYLSRVIGVEAGIDALGFAVFSIFMTVGRLSGDRLTEMFSATKLVRLGGSVATLGLLLVLFVPQLATTLIGFGIVGLGLSIVIPLAFSAAGRLPNIPASTGIAGVATIGYAGFLAGPPIIGLIAEATSLQIALLLVVLLTGSLIFTASSLKAETQEKTDAPNMS